MNNTETEQAYKGRVESLEALLATYKVIIEEQSKQIKLLHEFIRKGLDNI